MVISLAFSKVLEGFGKGKGENLSPVLFALFLCDLEFFSLSKYVYSTFYLVLC